MDIFKGIHEEFGWFIWGMVGIAALWFFTGGPNREIPHEGAYLKPLAPLNTGEAYGNYYVGSDGTGPTKLDLPETPSIFIRKTVSNIESFFIGLPSTQKISLTSLLSKKISFDGIGGARNTKPSEEYVRIVSSENITESISLSDLTLKSNSNDTHIAIPQAVELLTLGTTAQKKTISLPPDGRVLISSGRSPVGTSFRVNMCTGYLNQFQTYTPSLRTECPLPKEELKKAGLSNDGSCEEFVEKIPRCTVYEGKIPSTLSASCKAFVTNTLTYNACVTDHKKDTGFYKNEWRVFLDQNIELWKNTNEIIRLIDTKGKTVDALVY